MGDRVAVAIELSARELVDLIRQAGRKKTTTDVLLFEAVCLLQKARDTFELKNPLHNAIVDWLARNGYGKEDHDE